MIDLTSLIHEGFEVTRDTGIFIIICSLITHELLCVMESGREIAMFDSSELLLAQIEVVGLGE